MSASIGMRDSRVVLIMDSGRFVGPSIVELLAKRGHRLVVHHPTDQLVSHLVEMNAVFRVVPADRVPLDGSASIATEQGPRALLATCLEEFGRIDAAVIRSGRFVHGAITQVSIDEYEEVKQNLDISFYALRTLAEAMKIQGGGDIVMCTSAHGDHPTAEFSVYAAVRAAENALMRSTAMQYASDGVVINAIGTNFMRFPEFRGGWSDEYEDLRFETPRGELGTMRELAELCTLLLEGRARHLLGQFLSFSGGWS